jgi:hypothetical protein
MKELFLFHILLTVYHNVFTCESESVLSWLRYCYNYFYVYLHQTEIEYCAMSIVQNLSCN